MRQSKLKILNETGTCHAVLVSKVGTFIDRDIVNLEYSVIMHKKDFNFHNTFMMCGENKYLRENVLCDVDQAYFKSHQHLYRKVIDNKDGRVYEMKGFSFKKRYDMLNE